MTLLFDAALFVVSGCTALYCFTLGRRLRSLHNLRKGIGFAVTDLTRSVKEVEAKALRLNRDSSLAVSELGTMLAKVDAYESKVDHILGTMDQQARQTWKEHQGHMTATKHEAEAAVATLSASMEEAKSLVHLLNRQISAMATAAERQQALLDALRNKDVNEPVKVAPQAAPAEMAVTEPSGSSEKQPKSTKNAAVQRPWANAAAQGTSDREAEEQKARRIAEVIERLSQKRKKQPQPEVDEAANPFRRGASA